jgi:flagellar FliL protein
MAAEKELEIADGGNKKKKMIIIAAAAVVLLGGGGAAFMMMGGDPPPAAAAPAEGAPAADGGAAPATEGAATAAGGAAIGSALYVGMPRPFVFNVAGASRDRLVQIKAQLLVRGSQNEETAKQHIPLIESTMLRTFSKANADELVTAAGKETIKAAALKDVQEALKGVAGSPVVEEILFTGFVMQ